MSKFRKVYLQVQSNNIITDCISFPYDNYVEFEGEVPQDVYGGWYKLERGSIVECPDLKPVPEETEIEKLRVDMNEVVMELTMLVAMGGM